MSTKQLADLQTAIKKTLHSAAFAKLMGQAVQTAMAEAEPVSGAVLLPASPLSGLYFHEGNTYRSYEVTSEDGGCEVAMQCSRSPEDKNYAGVWYGSETRTDDKGRKWVRQLGRMVQDDFGMLVKVAA